MARLFGSCTFVDPHGKLKILSGSCDDPLQSFAPPPQKRKAGGQQTHVMNEASAAAAAQTHPGAAATLIIFFFIPAVSQIEMDTYDKNVTATRRVGRLTGLRVTF